MLDPHREYLGFRTVAILPAILFLPPLVSFATGPAKWAEYAGILFHLSVLFLVPRLAAPSWGRAAGYAWIGIDVLTGVLVVNDVPDDLTLPVRLGGHIFAGIWIASSSLCHRSLVIRTVGVVAGVWIGGYTFVATVLPLSFLSPGGVLSTAWYVLLAVLHQPAAAENTPDVAPDGAVRTAS